MKCLIYCVASLLLSSCAQHVMMSPEVRAKQADQLAKAAGWKEDNIHAPPFVLKTYGSHSYHSAILAIYIEGDGLAWINDETPSGNPTPMNPVGLRMALNNQRHGAAVYLARPCQYVFKDKFAACKSEYWTNKRFSPYVINAMNQAVSEVKKSYHAKQLILIGYSGGGTVAALIAARRSDVKKLITVAAVLDVKQWELSNSLTPLTGSLDPADEWKKLQSIPQTHWAGGQDTVVSQENAFAYANHFPVNLRPKIKVIPEYDHQCCWASAAFVSAVRAHSQSAASG